MSPGRGLGAVPPRRYAAKPSEASKPCHRDGVWGCAPKEHALAWSSASPGLAAQILAGRYALPVGTPDPDPDASAVVSGSQPSLASEGVNEDAPVLTAPPAHRALPDVKHGESVDDDDLPPRARAAMDSIAPRLVDPRRVGGYDVVALLGQGGAGEVYLAIHAGPGQFEKLVVLKMLHSHFQEDEGVVEMFLDEARLAARLSHPNIVQTIEVGVEEDRHFIAMAYLEGLPLHRVLARFGRRDEQIPAGVAARITVEVLDGLAYAHDLKDFDDSPLGIVHRDISPANIFLSWDGSVKILDFGIAKAATRRANTDSGIIKGKFGYIAPEQAKNGDINARADLWSVGVVLWEMLTSRRLFPLRNDVATLHALVGTDPLRQVTDYVPDAPPGLLAIVERALQRDPDARFQDALEMKAALEAWLDEQPHAVTRDDVAACIGDNFAGEREQQQSTVRACVGGARLAVAPSGSFHIAKGDPSHAFVVDPPPEPARANVPRGPLLLAAGAAAALFAIVVGSAWTHNPNDGRTVARGDTEQAQAATATEASAPESESATGRAGIVDAVDMAHGSATTVTESPMTEARTETTMAPAELPATETMATETTPEMAGGMAATMTGAADPGVVETEMASESVGETEAESEMVGEEPAEAPGFLTLDSSPWADVRGPDGRSLGHTPIVRVPLPPGQHRLILRNPERGIETPYVVQVRSGQTVTRRVALD